MDEPLPASRADAIAAYKTLLRSFVERRPLGLRGRLALALGKHKSFVSQITNPACGVPIPAADLPIIVDICHLSGAERLQLLALYREAHPEPQERLLRPGPAAHKLRVALPEFRREATAREVEALILDMAARILRLGQRAEINDQERAASDEEADQPGRGRAGRGIARVRRGAR
jgi:hypothetical protein